MSWSKKRLGGSKAVQRSVVVAWVCCVIVTFLTLLPVERAEGDDTNFAKWIAQSLSPAHWVWERYLNWSGRVFSEAAAAVFIPLDQMWWRAMDSLMVALLVYSMLRLTSTRVTASSVLMGYAGLWLMSPGIMLNSTYWVAGSFAYLWPAALAFFSSTLLMRIYRGEDVRHWGLYMPVALLASLGVEQVGLCLCAFGLLTVFAVWLRERHVSIASVVFSLVTVVGVLVEMIAPGSHLRTVSEAKNWYPEFSELSLSSKIMHGIVWQFSYATSYLLTIIVVLALGMLVVTVRQSVSTKPSEGMVVLDSQAASQNGLTVNIMGLVIALLTIVMCSDIIQIRSMIMVFPEWGQVPIVRWLMPISFWTILLGCLAFVVVKQSHFPTMMAFILLAAVAASAVMYFSPTIYASGPRSMFISSLLIITVIQLMRTEHSNHFWYWIIGVPAAVNFIHFVYEIHGGFSLSLFG